MSVRSYIEEFERRYNKPQINKVTVGFSGIDPTPKSESQREPDHSGSGTDKEIIQSLVASDEDINSMLEDVLGN